MRHMRSLLQDVVRRPTVAIKRLRSPSELASQDTGRVTGKSEVMQTVGRRCSPGYRRHETRLRLRRWPLPPLRPKRATCGVAASVPGVASEDKQCSNGGTVGERTALQAIPFNI